METTVVYDMSRFYFVLWSVLRFFRFDLNKCRRYIAEHQRNRKIEEFKTLRRKYLEDVNNLRDKYGDHFETILNDISELDRVCDTD